jgi:hypothetical protein
MCFVRVYHIFPHYLINGKIFEKVFEHKRCVWFSLQIFLSISHSKKNSARYDKNVHRSSRKIPVIVRF